MTETQRPATGPAASALDGIRERVTSAAPALAARRGLNSMADSAEDVPRLLAAVDAALAFHVEAVVEGMPKPRFRYCSTCSGHPAWPCPEVRAITTALAGKEAGDG